MRTWLKVLICIACAKWDDERIVLIAFGVDEESLVENLFKIVSENSIIFFKIIESQDKLLPPYHGSISRACVSLGFEHV